MTGTREAHRRSRSQRRPPWALVPLAAVASMLGALPMTVTDSPACTFAVFPTAPVPVVMEKCIMCHPHYEDAAEGEETPAGELVGAVYGYRSLHAGNARRGIGFTAATTILGLVPMAVGVSIDFTAMKLVVGSQSADWWGPMAVAVIFGLAFATVLTLVMVPTFYGIIEDLRSIPSKIRGRFRSASSSA